VADAAEAARRSMVSVVVVRDYQAEELDRGSLRLPAGQDTLVAAVAAANPRTVVVLQTGGPVLMPWLDRVPAVLAAWYGGERQGSAIASLLAGDANPGGRLPLTFPAAMADLPTSDASRHPGVEGVARYSEGLQVGYRHYDAAGIEPLLCFGHGLSFTTFAYRDLNVTAGPGPVIDVTFVVENTGRRAGDEVAQLYLGLPAGAGEPPRRLVGFRRLPLLPGEAAPVSFRLSPRDLSIWAGGGWTVPAGTFEVSAGASSRDLRLTAKVEVKA
jgi:beta-glucosidase